MVVTPAASICSLGGPVRKPYARVDYIPQSVTKSLASEPHGGLPTEYIFLLEMKQGNRVSVSAHSAGDYTATLLYW